MIDKMRDIQIKQVATLKQHLALPEEKGRQAAICLAHLVKPNSNSGVQTEALDALLDTLENGSIPQARTWAAWALGGLASSVTAYELSERVVPALIRALQLDAPGTPDVMVAGQSYHSLLYIGTPDAVAATEAYRTKVIETKRRAI